MFAKERSISCVFLVLLIYVGVGMNQRYFLVIKGIFMKLVKHLFCSLFVATPMLCSQVFAEEKVAEQAQPQAQVQQQTASQTPQQAVIDKLNINSASASDIQKALIGIGAKKAEAIVQYREKHGDLTVAEQLLEVQGIGKATVEKNRDRIVFVRCYFYMIGGILIFRFLYFRAENFPKLAKYQIFLE